MAVIDLITQRPFAPIDTRAEIEAKIDLLIDLLDALDGDPDLEPEEDCCEAHDDDLCPWVSADAGPGAPDDAEDTYDREEDPAEAGLCPPDYCEGEPVVTALYGVRRAAR